MNEKTAVQVWSRLRALVLERHDRRQEVCEALGMSFSKIKALRYLAMEPLTMRELTDRLKVDSPYTTLLVDDLEQRGLAERTAHPADRRRKIVTVTPEGVVAAARAEQIVSRPPAELLALDPADLAELARITAVFDDA
ncbi:MarR family winged helix-turn-helix transcriptional regulator [Amycolatopsis sp. H20-H5]|uniref:MarR family winged helix-turn-helix transcriptional regulator n=1 Tax=Amycolatopsis sp. H20-H5 TaxID=3046309 RepID=UPI002DBED9B3|nr:MarR family transcriptional regulator [Amycolatopsis sp. H20-H5]MEC3974770.1 MarR family transcriptional regulator [Amycolatopsis sp. H20-H5]